MPIQLLNLRAGGFASNSSSSHSFIWSPEIWQKLGGQDRGVERGEYGWGDFTILSKDGKADYLATALRNHLYNMPKEMVEVLLVQWFGSIPDKNAYIDHQSQPVFPRAYNSQHMDAEFFLAFRNYVMQDEVAILGGNDNNEGHPLKNINAWEFPITEDGFVVRRDPVFNHWSVFNPYNGVKMRFRFADARSIQLASFGESAPMIDRASAPELVDCSITNFCPYNCPFCYTGATARGAHASLSSIERIHRALGKLKVWEIAYGGGEPTLHPNFVEILRHARSVGLTPNFTTRNLAWLRDWRYSSEILSLIGGFAYSAPDADSIEELAALLRLAPRIHTNVYDSLSDFNRVSIHLVMGTMNRYEFADLVKAASRNHFRVTLLGWKNTGRAVGQEMIPYDWWMDCLSGELAKFHPSVNIDTLMADQYVELLKDKKFPTWMYHIQEGRWSCFVDAVNNKIAPSSYNDGELVEMFDPERYRTIEEDANRISTLFQTFG